MDLVSIITPSFNSARFIKDTISSVINQCYNNWEMIIIDDASIDNSVDIVKSIAEMDSRIQLIESEENLGPAVARNAGIDVARGRFIAFLDADDLWHPQKLEKQITYMLKYNHTLTYTWYEKITELGEKTGRIVRSVEKLTYSDLLKSNQIGCLTAIYDTKILGKMYMPLIRKRQDYGLWLSILKKIKYAYCLEESLAYYRLRNHSVSSDKCEMLRYNWQLFREIEGLSILKSAYYVMWNVKRKIIL